VLIQDQEEVTQALRAKEAQKKILEEKIRKLKTAEYNVENQNLKLSQNEDKLYSGAISNPKELEDLQQESISLKKYLIVLEDRQLEAMLAAENAQNEYDQLSSRAQELTSQKEAENKRLEMEKKDLEARINLLETQRNDLLTDSSIPHLSVYEKIRQSSGGIAVTLMSGSSCSACGASIPSAIQQEARSPTKLAFCPACKRILHPEPR
jgi:hypothetical protein